MSGYNPNRLQPTLSSHAGISATHILPGQNVLNSHIDYGTMYYSEGTQICQAGEKPDPYQTHILQLCPSSNRQEVPQMVGYVDRGGDLPEFVHGIELQMLLGSKEERQVVAHFEHLKLAVLGAGKEATDSKQSIEAELQRLGLPERNVDELFVRHLEELRAASLAATSRRFRGQDLSSIPAQVFFAVPEIVKLAERNKLARLLKQAGYPKLRFVPETEAAGAWHAYRFYHKNKGRANELFAIGNEILVVDLGGWTCNIALYQVTGPVKEENAQMGMKASGKTACLQLGSEMITKKFAEHVKNYYRNLKPRTLEDLGLSEDQVIQQATRDFESFKCGIGGGRESSRTIKIKGTNAGPYHATHGYRKQKHIDITAEQVMIWIDDAVGKIIAGIDRIRSPDTKVIALTGGFSLNSHLSVKLRDHYDALGIVLDDAGKDDLSGGKDLAIVRGSAARWSGKVESTPVPCPYSIGMSQYDPFDEQDHPEITSDSPELITQPGRDQPYLAHRWKTLLPRGTMIDSKSPYSHETWLEFFIEPNDDPERMISIWQGEGHDHEAIYLDGKPRPDFVPLEDITFRIEHEVVKRMPEKRKYIKTRGSRGQTKTSWVPEGHWLHLLVKVTVGDMIVAVSLWRMPEKYNPRKQHGIFRVHTPPPDTELILVPHSSPGLYDFNYPAIFQRLEGNQPSEPARSDDQWQDSPARESTAEPERFRTNSRSHNDPVRTLRKRRRYC